MASKNAYSYIRFSRDLQSKGDSFRRQLANTRSYCTRLGLTLDESLELRDLGVSGFKGKNIEKGALGKFILACQEGRVKRGSALVVESLDRLTRQSPRKAVALLTTLLDVYEIEVHVTSLNKVFRPDSKDEGIDLILAVAMAIRGNEESETKSQRLQEVWAQKRRRANETKEFMRKDLPWWLLEKDGKIFAPPDRAAVVTEIYQLTADGNSSAQVARKLNAKGSPTWRRQSKWTSARVRGLVNSKGAQGVLQATPKTKAAGRDYTLNGYYPAIVSDGLAAAARDVLLRNVRGNRGRSSAHTRPINVFRGLLRHKGLWTRYATSQNGTRDKLTGKKAWNGYYECFNELGARDHGKLLFCISGKQLEPVVFAGLAELTPSDLNPPAPDSHKTKISILRGEILELEEKKKNLLAALESGSSSVVSRLVEVEAECAAKSKEHDVLVRMDAPISVNTKEFRTLTQDLLNPDVRQRAAVALRRMVTRIDIARTFSELNISDELRKRYFTQYSELVAKARVFQDPVADDRRRKPLHVLVTFANGVARYIARPDNSANQLVSWRLESGVEPLE